MVNNSTNSSKTNNQHSPQVIEHKKKIMTYDLELQVVAWNRHKNVAGLNQFGS